MEDNLATSITFCVQNKTSLQATCTLTADSDASPAIGLVNGYLQGGAYSTRSGASNYDVTVQYSLDGTNWLTLGNMTQAAASVAFTAASVSAARFIRFIATTVNSQTITVFMRIAR